MTVLCNGCGASFPLPAGYARARIQCPECGVICESSAAATPRAAGPASPSRPEAAPTPFDEPPIEAVPVAEAPRPAAREEARRLLPCRRCGKMIPRLGECECYRGLDQPLPPEPVAAPAPMSLSLDEPSPPPSSAGPDEEEESPYGLIEPPGPTCPRCRREMVRGSVLCVSCGFDLRTRRKLKRTFTPITRVWEADLSLAGRLGWFAAAQAFHLVLGLVVFALAGTFTPALVTWPLLIGMMLFLLGTYARVELRRDEKGKVTITKAWRAFFIPQEPDVIEVRGYEGVVCGPWQSVGCLEWFVCISLFTLGIVPGLVYYYYAIHMPTYSVALSENHGQTSEYIYRGHSQEQMNEIANAIADAAGFRRVT